jgi:hypothetical protein
MAKDIARDLDARSVAGTERRPFTWGACRRFAKWFRAMRRRTAEREVARLFRENGGELTDELERKISRVYARIVGI